MEDEKRALEINTAVLRAGVGKKQDELILEAKGFFDAHKKEIGKSIRAGENVVKLNFSQLAEFSPVLSDNMIQVPEDRLAFMETALGELGLVENPRIRLEELPRTSYIKVRDIRAKHLDQLLWIDGIVRQASDVRPQVVNAKFECPNCGAILSVLQIDRKFREPSRCSCGWKSNFKILSKEMVDAQRLVIEESPDALEGGEQPRRINVFLKEDLVDPKMEGKTTPGSRVSIYGILKEVPVPLQTGAISTRFDIAVEANNAISGEEGFEDLDISEEDIRQIQELAVDPNLYERLSKSIAPSIYGFDKIKEAVLLQLFGGVKKKKSDVGFTRGDIHVLLVGDPGVAKSVLLKYISIIAPKGRYVSGKAATAAGLTAAVVKDEFLRGWSLEAGAMVLSNKGTVCIDEIEKMSEQDRSTMHEAMEQQCYLPDFEIMFADGSKKKIGTFVDYLIEKNADKVEQGVNCEILSLDENNEILTTDFESIYPAGIKNVSRHIAPDKFVRIILSNGREVTVTPEHPCWAVKDGRITTVAAKNLKEEEFFPVPVGLITGENIKVVSDIYQDGLQLQQIKKSSGRIGWIKVQSVNIIRNPGLKWVYDIMIEPTHSFISNGMILHNSVTISKANIQATLRAETTVLAAGNPKLGRFDPYTPIPNQIDISPALLSRFDVIFIIRDLPNKIQDAAIAKHVLEEHQQEVIRDVVEPKLFRKYVAYAKQKVKPKLTNEAVEEIKEFYIRLRNQPGRADSELKPIPITARQLEGIVRLAEAHAKMRLNLEVTREDAKKAIELVKFSLMQVGYDEETKSFDVDRMTTGITTSKRGKILLVRETIAQLESRLGKLIPSEELERALEGKITALELDEALMQLSKSGDIFKPKKGFIQRI